MPHLSTGSKAAPFSIMRRKDRREGPGGSINTSIPFRRDLRSNEGTVSFASFTVGAPGTEAIIKAMTPVRIEPRRIPKPSRQPEYWFGSLMDRTIVSVSREPGAKEVAESRVPGNKGFPGGNRA